MTDLSLPVAVRSETGKGASRRLRRLEQLVPAILYGAGKDPVMLSVEDRVLRKLMEVEAFFTQVISLDINGKSEKAVLRDIQRHPAKDNVLHLDFLRVTGKEHISMTVPFHFINEDTCPGVKKGGIVSHVLTELSIKTLPKHLPEFIEIDLAKLELDEAIHLSDITLPKGVEFAHEISGPHDSAVVSVHLPKRAVETTETEAEDGSDSTATDGNNPG